MVLVPRCDGRVAVVPCVRKNKRSSGWGVMVVEGARLAFAVKIELAFHLHTVCPTLSFKLRVPQSRRMFARAESIVNGNR